MMLIFFSVGIVFWGIGQATYLQLREDRNLPANKDLKGRALSEKQVMTEYFGGKVALKFDAASILAEMLIFKPLKDPVQ
jgi:hypothetical protein